MLEIFWFLISLLLLFMLLGLVTFWLQQRRPQPLDYYLIFILGLTWLMLGLVLGNTAFVFLGLVLTIVAVVNRKQWQGGLIVWQQTSAAEKNLIAVIITLISVLLVISCVAFYFQIKIMTKIITANQISANQLKLS